MQMVLFGGLAGALWRASMIEPTFDIFSGGPDKDSVWLEAVAGLSNARERMDQLAEKSPGQYFVFSIGSQSIIAKTETFKKLNFPKAKPV